MRDTILSFTLGFIKAVLAVFVGFAASLISGTALWCLWDYVQPIFFTSVPGAWVHPQWWNVVILSWFLETVGRLLFKHD